MCNFDMHSSRAEASEQATPSFLSSSQQLDFKRVKIVDARICERVEAIIYSS